MQPQSLITKIIYFFAASTALLLVQCNNRASSPIYPIESKITFALDFYERLKVETDSLEKALNPSKEIQKLFGTESQDKLMRSLKKHPDSDLLIANYKFNNFYNTCRIDSFASVVSYKNLGMNIVFDTCVGNNLLVLGLEKITNLDCLFESRLIILVTPKPDSFTTNISDFLTSQFEQDKYSKMPLTLTFAYKINQTFCNWLNDRTTSIPDNFFNCKQEKLNKYIHHAEKNQSSCFEM